MLNAQRSQSPEAPSYMIPFIQNIQSKYIHRIRIQTGGYQELGDGRTEGDCLMVIGFSLGHFGT